MQGDKPPPQKTLSFSVTVRETGQPNPTAILDALECLAQPSENQKPAA